MNHKDLKGEILQKIEKGEIEMRSSAFFALRLGLFSLFTLLALILSILIFNFIFFSIRASEEAELLGFGTRGLLFFVEMFPWPLLFLDILFVAAAERMLRHFRFGYRHSVVIVLGALLVATVLLGLALDRGTPLNDHMLSRAHHRSLGPIDDLYESARRPGPAEGGICRCVITDIQEDAITAFNKDASTTPLRLLLPPGFATSSLRIGETIFVAGDRIGEVIQIFGIHRKPPPTHTNR